MAAGTDKVAVVGLGRSGVAAARFLAERAIPVLACDDHPQPPAAAELSGLAGVTLHSGGLPAEALVTCRAILLSPGIPRNHAALAPALAAGVPVINDVEWLWREVTARRPDILFVGITGANGKSTVTTLVGEMLTASGLAVQTGGNLGQAALSLYQPEAQGYVLELSSFQLESVAAFRPQVGVLLNLTPDHLDRYSDLAAYRRAKERLFANQVAGDWAVVNADDPALAGTRRQLGHGPGNLLLVSGEGALPGGLYVGETHLIDHRGRLPQPLLPLSEIRLVGHHNRFNAAAAAAVTLLAGGSVAAVVEVLRRFPGLPHRMEWVRTLDGVAYYNDSKGTNVGAVAQSLRGFAGGVVLIAGGRDKKGDFTPLAPLVRERAAAVVLIGEAADDIERALTGQTRIERALDLTDAVRRARRLAPPGGTVLLSPACASFDMFANFEDRGQRFKEAVHAL